jgi:hypothetical protein
VDLRAAMLSRALDLLERIGRLSEAAAGGLIDVGAGIGTVTIPAIRSHGFAGAICFEAEPRDRLLLRLNCALNDVGEAVELHPFMLSDGRTGTQPSLDRMVQDGSLDPEDLGLVWIGAEGRAMETLRGASELAKHGVPVVIEHADELVGQRELVDELLESAEHGYRAFVSLGPAGRRGNRAAKPLRRTAIRGMAELAQLNGARRATTSSILILGKR